ncbi:MAG: transposase [Candidatus Accumulibacter sp.]|jgi:transposase|uniref:transposase n=1 Tax=Accumulibacter sp. TaxID=2053492 RepID=UPI001A4BB1A5|nr:transposase [Accumulibacter sp.]MBL8395527.1 transposase [Accumulibacter sp.]
MKIAKQAYTTGFSEPAVRRVKDRRNVSTVAEDLGLVEQTLRNWVRTAAAGKLG